LTDFGLTGTLADPTLSVFDASGSLIAENDNWASDPRSAELSANGLAPDNTTEAAIVTTLDPGAYTVVATGKDSDSGLGLVEVYDLNPDLDSRMANISTRGSVGTGDQVLISGVIIGDVSNTTLLIRALGPSLAVHNVSDPLSDPTFSVFDSNGTAIATNDNWQDDIGMADVEANGLAPSDPAESATILHPPAGAYSIVVSGVGGTTGASLLEIYDLD
jgi:hypothetical protein